MAKRKVDPVDRAKVKIECLRAITTLKLDPARVALLSWFVDSYRSLKNHVNKEFCHDSSPRLAATNITRPIHIAKQPTSNSSMKISPGDKGRSMGSR
jgi:hypothetical protein